MRSIDPKNCKILLDNTIVGTVVAQGLKMRIVFINKKLASMIGYTMSEMQSMNVTDIAKLIHPEDRQAFIARYLSRIRGERQPKDIEVRVFHKNGSIKWFSYHAEKISFNEKPAVQASFVDITEQKNIGIELEKAQFRYELAANVTGQMFYDYDVETGKIEWFGAITDVLGFSTKEFQKVNIKKWEQMIHPEDRKGALKELTIAQKRVGSYDVKYRFKNNDEKYVIIQDIGSFVKLDGEKLRMLGSMRDITFAEEAKRVIERNEEQLQGVLNSMEELVFEIDDKKEFVFFHASEHVELYMHSAAFLNKKYSDVMPQDVVKQIDNGVRENQRNKMAKFTYSLEIEGRELWFRANMTPIFRNKKYSGSVAVIRDITLEKEIDIIKTEFVSIASHQLRTPITSIGWNCEILLKNGELEESQRELVQDILHSNKRMNELIKALLNVARLETGQVRYRSTLVHPLDTCEMILNDLEPKIKEKRLKFKKVCPPDLDPVKLDVKMLEIILQNLISNAVKYSRPNTTIIGSYKRIKGGIQISIEDKGIGIANSEKGKIFTKMYRTDSAKLKDPDGTGLGLYIVKLILEQIGGKIWFESKKGEGSTFYVEIPTDGSIKKGGDKPLE